MIDINKPRYIHAVMNLVGSIDVSGIADGPLDVLRFHEEVTLPSEEDIQTELTKLQAEYNAQAYARNRATAYDSVGDQLDQLMKDMRDGTTTHQTACEAVKAKYPKP